MPELDYFIDCHHHMFTLADVPAYQTIHQAACDHLSPFKKLKLPIILAFYLPAINPEHKVEKLENFIRFFENEPEEAVKQVVDEVLELLKKADNLKIPFTVNGNKILLTPLVMDMDSGGSGAKKRLNKLPGQIKRLAQAIKDTDCKTAKVLPFIGIDPRRMLENSDNSITTIKSLLTEIKPLRTVTGGYENAENGSFIGIKLYPSLGFHPAECKHICLEAAKSQIPITVHCQKGSLCLVDKGDDLNHPDKWEEVLDEVNAAVQAEGKSLIINFAHFGGEEEVAHTILYPDSSVVADDGQPATLADDKRVYPATWTYTIIKMLKKHPEAYADISAFDFDSHRAISALHWIIYLDSKGIFNELGPCAIEKKLLWGSDYPMTLKEGNITYSHLFQDFVNAVNRTDNFNWPHPPVAMSNTAEFIKKLVCDNPKKFLGTS